MRRAARIGAPAAPRPLASSAASAAVPAEPSGPGAFARFSELFSNLFPLWTVLSAGIALKAPQSLAWFSTSFFTGALAMLMLSMGITLTVDDFKRVLSRPGPVGLGFVLCYGMMPLLALAIAKALALPAPLTAGLVLIGCINGGQASNLCTYIARGDVALSVIMTTSTTIGGRAAARRRCARAAAAPVRALRRSRRGTAARGRAARGRGNGWQIGGAPARGRIGG